MEKGHVPVLADAVIRLLAPRPGEAVVDCTLGLGGHAERFLDAVGPQGHLIALDADATNLASARERLARFSGSTEFHHVNFRDMASVIRAPVNIIFADLGLSSPHLDDPERGFTFRTSAPLDMRYNREFGESAAELLVRASQEEIAGILSRYGELPRSHALSRALFDRFHGAESATRVWTTDDVVACVEKVFTYRAPRVLPQVFQGIRIAVNDELGALISLLEALPDLLLPGGRVGIISYHSLEDRIVKQAFRLRTTPVLDTLTGQIALQAPFELLTRKSVTAGEEELARNPRSRSARLRVMRRQSSHETMA